jgi:hypothetical protein
MSSLRDIEVNKGLDKINYGDNDSLPGFILGYNQLPAGRQDLIVR